MTIFVRLIRITWRHYINKNIMKNLWNQKQYYHITIVVFDPCLISFNEQLVEVMGNLCACLIVCRVWAVCVCVFQSWNIKSNETIIRFSLSLALSLLYSHMSHGKMKMHTRERSTCDVMKWQIIPCFSL